MRVTPEHVLKPKGRESGNISRLRAHNVFVEHGSWVYRPHACQATLPRSAGPDRSVGDGRNVVKDGDEVAKYTELGTHEVRALADQYGLILDGFTPIEGGAGNSSYLLQSQQRSTKAVL